MLLLAYATESAHYYLIHRLGLAHSVGAYLVLGSQFAWLNLVAYTLGTAVALVGSVPVRGATEDFSSTSAQVSY